MCRNNSMSNTGILWNSFGENISSLPWFMRDYLTMKIGSIPNIASVYDTFKNYYADHKETLGVEGVVKKDLYRYSQFYVKLALRKETDKSILPVFKAIGKLRMDTSYPFLLAVYGDYENRNNHQGRVFGNTNFC